VTPGVLWIVFDHLTDSKNPLDFARRDHPLWSRHLPDRMREEEDPHCGCLPDPLQDIFIHCSDPFLDRPGF